MSYTPQSRQKIPQKIRKLLLPFVQYMERYDIFRSNLYDAYYTKIPGSRSSWKFWGDGHYLYNKVAATIDNDLMDTIIDNYDDIMKTIANHTSAIMPNIHIEPCTWVEFTDFYYNISIGYFIKDLSVLTLPCADRYIPTISQKDFFDESLTNMFLYKKMGALPADWVIKLFERRGDDPIFPPDPKPLLQEDDGAVANV